MPLAPQLQEAIRGVLRRHPEIRLAMVFGSRARGVAAPDADPDLAVELTRGAELDRLGLMAELRAATGLDVDVVDVSPGRRVSYPLLAALVREGVVVHEGAPTRRQSSAPASSSRPLSTGPGTSGCATPTSNTSPPAPMVDENVIAAKLAELADRIAQALARAVGLRNVVAHVDAPADPELVHRVATTGLDDLEQLSCAVAAWLRSRREDG
ncbi:MAG: nucleotidyltransferase domain-containing protein [Thermoanaerobaculia bacterium]